MWIWVTPSAEIAVLESFTVGQKVTWWCRSASTVELVLPADVERAPVLIEDSDYGSGDFGDDRFVKVHGCVARIRVAIDEWHTKLILRGSSWLTQYEPLPGTRTWYDYATTTDARKIPGPGFSGLLVELNQPQRHHQRADAGTDIMTEQAGGLSVR